MRDFIDVTGKNEEEAIAKALSQLNMDRDDVSVEILERAKSGFLGFGSSPARVRVYYGPEEETAPKPPRTERTPAAPRAESAPARAERRPRQEPKAPEEPKREEPRAEEPEKRQSAAGQESPRPPRRERTRQKRQERPAPPPAEETRPAPAPQDLGEECDDEKAQAIRSFLTGLLQHMECTAEIRVYQPEKGRYKVLLEGRQMGALIGRRGETLDAIQQLTSYSVNRTGGGSRVRVQLDAEGYRDKREQSLQALARKVAAKVVKYRRSVTLEPMNAYERHVIHTALQDVPGVTTYSTGTDPNRRVIVAYDRTTVK